MFFNWNRKRRYSKSYQDTPYGKVVAFRFIVKGKEVTVVCVKAPASDAVVLPSYNSCGEHPSVLFYNETDFAGDLQKMIALIGNKEMTAKVLFHAYDTFITGHIQKEHRLIDTDIYRIAAEFLLLADAVTQAETGRRLTEDEKHGRVRGLIDRAFCKFTKYLYITHYRIKDESLEPYLIKT